MPGMKTATMRDFLSASIASNRQHGVLNMNKLRGLLAEVDFRNHLNALGFGGRISLGGWIARKTGPGEFGRSTVALFPEVVSDGAILTRDRVPPEPSRGLHTICSTFHQIGIHSYFCVPDIKSDDDPSTLKWNAVQLGTPVDAKMQTLEEALPAYLRPRDREYNFLTYKTDLSSLPDEHVTEEFIKEHLRVSFQTKFMSEVSDIDGIFWGSQYTYPLEIKEKTCAPDRNLGDFFGLDVGPFVKLAYYSAKRGNLHSMFVVREITDTETRELKQWWFITFEKLAQYASWNQQGGGTNMRGGGSTVVKIPKDQFLPMTKNELEKL